MCVCFLPIYSGHHVPAGVAQEEDHTTRFLIHLPSAVRALIFFARRIQPSFPSSTVKLNFVYERFSRSPLVGHFFFFFLVRKIPFTGIELTSQRVRRLRGYLCATGARTVNSSGKYYL